MQEMCVQSLSWEDSPGGGNGNPVQYSCPRNPIDRGAWWATVHRVAQSQTQPKQLSMHTESFASLSISSVYEEGTVVNEDQTKLETKISVCRVKQLMGLLNI